MGGFIMGISYGDFQLYFASDISCQPRPGQPRPALAGPARPGPAKPAQPSQAKLSSLKKLKKAP